MAAAAFASLPELVRCLAEQVRVTPVCCNFFFFAAAHALQTRSRKQLVRLCRTSKTFNLVVAPVLFREVCFRTETLSAIADCAHLGHVRLLEVSVGHGEGEVNEI